MGWVIINLCSALYSRVRNTLFSLDLFDQMDDPTLQDEITHTDDGHDCPILHEETDLPTRPRQVLPMW